MVSVLNSTTALLLLVVMQIAAQMVVMTMMVAMMVVVTIMTLDMDLSSVFSQTKILSLEKVRPNNWYRIL